MREPAEEIEFLLDVHDGDDRCRCLRRAVIDALDGDEQAVLTVLRNCIAEHHAGITYRHQQTGEERPLGC